MTEPNSIQTFPDSENISTTPSDTVLLEDLNNAPSSQAGYSDYYNDNNFIGAGVDNQIVDSQRCSILQGSSNQISGKYNSHIIGDYIGRTNTQIENNSFNIGCYNGVKSWGPLTIERGGTFIKGGINTSSDLSVWGGDQGFSKINLGYQEFNIDSNGSINSPQIKIHQGTKVGFTVITVFGYEVGQQLAIWASTEWFFKSRIGGVNGIDSDELYIPSTTNTTSTEGWFLSAFFNDWIFVNVISHPTKRRFWMYMDWKKGTEIQYIWMWIDEGTLNSSGLAYVSSESQTILQEGWIIFYKSTDSNYDFVIYHYSEQQWYVCQKGTSVDGDPAILTAVSNGNSYVDNDSTGIEVPEDTFVQSSSIIDDEFNLYISSYESAKNTNLHVEGDVVAYYSSDERLKNNILSIDNCLNKVMSLDAVSFDWNKKQNAYSGHDIGLIAQQVNEVAPEIVEERKDGYLALKYEKMVPLLVGAIKDQQKIIDEMREEIKELKNQITR